MKGAQLVESVSQAAESAMAMASGVVAGLPTDHHKATVPYLSTALLSQPGVSGTKSKSASTG